MCSYVGWLSSRSPVYEVPVYEVLKMPALDSLHCVESVQIGSFFRSVFSRIRTEYGEIRSISPWFSSRSPVYEVPVYEVIKKPVLDSFHCVKSVQIRSFFWSVFFRVRTDWIFISNAGKYGPEKTLYLNTFHVVLNSKTSTLVYII